MMPDRKKIGATHACDGCERPALERRALLCRPPVIGPVGTDVEVRASVRSGAAALSSQRTQGSCYARIEVVVSHRRRRVGSRSSREAVDAAAVVCTGVCVCPLPRFGSCCKRTAMTRCRKSGCTSTSSLRMWKPRCGASRARGDKVGASSGARLRLLDSARQTELSPLRRRPEVDLHRLGADHLNRRIAGSYEKDVVQPGTLRN